MLGFSMTLCRCFGTVLILIYIFSAVSLFAQFVVQKILPQKPGVTMLSGPSWACGEAGFDEVRISLAVLPNLINRTLGLLFP